MFKGLHKDGDPLFDSQESAIEYAKMKVQWSEPGTKIMVQRPRIPLWFCHLVQETRFEFLAYTELK
jgi:hypothetical protein